MEYNKVLQKNNNEANVLQFIPFTEDQPIRAENFHLFLSYLQLHQCQFLVIHAQEISFDVSPTREHGEVGVFVYFTKYVSLTRRGIPIIFREVSHLRHGSEHGTGDANVRLLSDIRLLKGLNRRVPEIRSGFPTISLTITWKDGSDIPEGHLPRFLSDFEKYYIPS